MDVRRIYSYMQENLYYWYGHAHAFAQAVHALVCMCAGMMEHSFTSY